MVNQEAFQKLSKSCEEAGARLIAVSKTKPTEDILALYKLGQRAFGENYVQELCEKQKELEHLKPEWHFIGHLQRNKVKQIVPFCTLIHGVDSLRLLEEINRQAMKIGGVQDVLLQVYIATEESKFGMDEVELLDAMKLASGMKGVRICGLMGMASQTDNKEQIRGEFRNLRLLFERCIAEGLADQVSFKELSMGMSSDYELALSEGSTLIRIGSLLFGARS